MQKTTQTGTIEKGKSSSSPLSSSVYRLGEVVLEEEEEEEEEKEREEEVEASGE